MHSTLVSGLGSARWLLSILLLLMAHTPSPAQPRPAAAPPTPPQLWQALREHPQPDTARVRLLLRLEEVTYSLLPPDRLDSLVQQALLLSRQLNFPDGQARAMLRRVGVGFRRGTPPDLALLRQALPLAARSADKRISVYVLSALANYSPGKEGLPYLLRARAAARATGKPALLAQEYLSEHRYFNLVLHDNYQALQAASRVLPVARRAGLLLEEVRALESIGDVYIYLDDYEQARASYRQELSRARALSDTTQRTRWVSTALTGLADCDRFSGRYALALAGYERALRLARGTSVELLVKVRVADTYERQHSPLALPYARQVLREVNQTRNIYRAWVCTTLGQYFLRTNRPDSAVYYGRQAVQEKAMQEKETLRDAVLLLAQAYAQLRQYGPAYAYQRRYAGLRDSLNSEATTRQATAARFADDMARQKSRIGLLTRNQQLQADAARRQRLLLFAALAVLALLAGLGFVLWRANRRQQRANEQLSQLNAAVTAQRGELQTQRDQLDASLTELQATQAQLIQKEKMASLGELTAGIAHEIQNPLNFVNNFAEVSTELLAELEEEQAKLIRDADLEAELVGDLRQNLGKISHHGRRAAAIVRGMLEHSRTSTGERAPADVNRLCEEYLRLAYQGLRANDKSFNAALETDFALDLPRVPVVGADVGRVLLNLFGNAFYAVQKRQQTGETGYAPTVRVSTKHTGHQVEICVADNGTGMPAEVQAKIFQPFFTTKPTGEGTGLGLSLSYDIITQGHGGRLTVESPAGNFTEFLISLPFN
ncbi:tetratricopeptide repeat-containing sensor histidine kinase [Hymenobacter convexus]|uniref:tetratricopeptide repeat-containing sensor histidine kinase n=1 Tax=Hymenobacter sp. CA1UV-4 TaxID=3063782 RepID=UPI002712A94C|nr:ATP-binding protein [Hymenobacter sp. CA1UV-4]MDO7850207.1 ATP-binding protein [Hymenobacter sp. CA1UV-4]